ncbi:Ubiquitin conjugation factor E4 A [Geodia barretti]|uniref:Ubiquitin conjugation factor E4 A n=1 Tax=Geodia barretti TaxID=519541 RepID=A0AA35RTQ6_GEOBA|nr:Ubiquitin conjugation factor E4 A [Geodia barretti]
MYNILKFVWKLPTYQTSINVLITEAVEYNGSKQEIPIFLRFINMIVNDATVQLDEGLENMVLIGELQRKRQSEWDSYNDEQKKEHQQKMQEASVMASNRNQLASYTVDVLELITRELQAPFVIPSMVDRISAMLNYVLKQLVGPKRRQLNVEDMDKFHFKPKELVSSIVAIYVNLGQSSEFCRALPQDGRSFSIELLEESARIMRNLGYVELMEKMTSLIDRVHKYSNRLQMEESALDDAPEEFLDPVTSELMKEPVRLPTSGVTMDKSNIMRHLFSDGTDPFNRSPLTADMLEPDNQLRQRILDWKSQKLAHLTHNDSLQ